MWEDPIVAEVRAIREKLAAEFNFDVKEIFADLRKRQGSRGGRLIRQSDNPEKTVEVDRSRKSDSSSSKDREAFERVLDKAADVPPMAGDEW